MVTKQLKVQSKLSFRETSNLDLFIYIYIYITRTQPNVA